MPDPSLLTTPAARWILGAVAAGTVALLARRAGSLSASGAAAAVLVGTLAVAAGWRWGALLVAYFIATSAVSRVGGEARARRLESVVSKGGERDLVQVLANGGLFAAAAVGQLLLPSPGWSAVALGALAAAASDSWATEFGTLGQHPPRLILGLRQVPAGTSGAISAIGTAASVAGALFVAGIAWALGWSGTLAATAVAGGVSGSIVDSLIGATLQARRHCDQCDRATERIVHGCGRRTRPAGGVPWVDNDVVNLAATAAGATTTLVIHGWWLAFTGSG